MVLSPGSCLLLFLLRLFRVFDQMVDVYKAHGKVWQPVGYPDPVPEGAWIITVDLPDV